jgi:hypothetical protein
VDNIKVNGHHNYGDNFVTLTYARQKAGSQGQDAKQQPRNGFVPLSPVLMPANPASLKISPVERTRSFTLEQRSARMGSEAQPIRIEAVEPIKPFKFIPATVKLPQLKVTAQVEALQDAVAVDEVQPTRGIASAPKRSAGVSPKEIPQEHLAEIRQFCATVDRQRAAAYGMFKTDHQQAKRLLDLLERQSKLIALMSRGLKPATRQKAEALFHKWELRAEQQISSLSADHSQPAAVRPLPKLPERTSKVLPNLQAVSAPKVVTPTLGKSVRLLELGGKSKGVSSGEIYSAEVPKVIIPARKVKTKQRVYAIRVLENSIASYQHAQKRGWIKPEFTDLVSLKWMEDKLMKIKAGSFNDEQLAELSSYLMQQKLKYLMILDYAPREK